MVQACPEAARSNAALICAIRRANRNQHTRHRPHGQALHRRQAGASRLRLQHGGALARRPLAGRGSSWQPKGHSQRRRSRAKSRSVVQGDGAQSRAGSLLRARKTLASAGTRSAAVSPRWLENSKLPRKLPSVSNASSRMPPGQISSKVRYTTRRSVISQSR